MHHDKKFLAWFLPLAIATFLSAPLAVLHAFGLLESVVALQLHAYGVSDTAFEFALAESTTSNAVLPDELPLLFRMESYPHSGKKTLEVHDVRLMDLAFGATNGSENLGASPMLLGYVPIVEMQAVRTNDTFSFPEGHLILVTRVLYESSLGDSTEQLFMRLETRRSHRFRVKTVRKDDATGVLFGHVEWIQ